MNNIAFICTECAKKHGGEWPKGHYATWHNGTCDVCNEKAFVCSYDDWKNLKIEGQEVDLGGRD